MTVRVYEHHTGTRSNWLQKFLDRYHVQHEALSSEDLGSSASYINRYGEAAAVEVDGRLFVNPNEDALKKILHVG